MNTLVLSLFKNRTDADAATDELHKSDIKSEDISVLLKEDRHSSPISRGATAGAATGGIIGGIAGLLFGIGAIVIPGIGAVLVGGPLIQALGLTGAAAAAGTTVAGGITGAVTGGLVGSLIGLGLSREEAHLYETEIKEGAILLAINVAPEKIKNVKTILNRHFATEIKTLPVDENESPPPAGLTM